MFEDRVLRKVFGLNKEEVTGDWRKLHNEQFYNPYFIPNIIRVIKLRSMRCAGHVECMGRKEMNTGFWRGFLT
jgi:hypothetical protein